MILNRCPTPARPGTAPVQIRRLPNALNERRAHCSAGRNAAEAPARHAAAKSGAVEAPATHAADVCLTDKFDEWKKEQSSAAELFNSCLSVVLPIVKTEVGKQLIQLNEGGGLDIASGYKLRVVPRTGDAKRKLTPLTSETLTRSRVSFAQGLKMSETGSKMYETGSKRTQMYQNASKL